MGWVENLKRWGLNGTVDLQSERVGPIGAGQVGCISNVRCSLIKKACSAPRQRLACTHAGRQVRKQTRRHAGTLAHTARTCTSGSAQWASGRHNSCAASIMFPLERRGWHTDVTFVTDTYKYIHTHTHVTCGLGSLRICWRTTQPCTT